MSHRQPGETAGLSNLNDNMQMPSIPMLDAGDHFKLEDLQACMDDETGARSWSMMDVVRQLQHLQLTRSARNSESAHVSSLHNTVRVLEEQAGNSRNESRDLKSQNATLKTQCEEANNLLAEANAKLETRVTQDWHHSEMDGLRQKHESDQKDLRKDLETKHREELRSIKTKHLEDSVSKASEPAYIRFSKTYTDYLLPVCATEQLS
jgi:hypothetical protein